MEQQPRIVALGGVNMDLVAMVDRFPAPGETVVGRAFTTYPGGKGANQAVAAARLGAQVCMIGRVGGDAFGRELREGLAREGIDVSGVAIDPDAVSGIAVIQIDASGQNRIVQVLGANRRCGQQEAEAVGKALVGASALMLQVELPLELSLKAAQAASSQGCRVILDPAPAPADALPAELYSLCHCITPNETEAEALVGFPVSDLAAAAQAARELVARGAWSAVVKMGERGASVHSPEGSGHVPPFVVEAVDTVAAGDAFNGALAVALCQGRPMLEAARWAAAAGALAVTRVGAQDAMPRRHEVEALVRGEGP